MAQARTEQLQRDDPTRSGLRILQLATRLNVGGLAQQVVLSGQGLSSRGHEVLVAYGRSGRREGSMRELAVEFGLPTRTVPALRRDPSPIDLQALVAITRLLGGFQPDVLHTHGAKAGAVGRLAGRWPRRDRCATIHTYHGHSFTDQFGKWAGRGYLAIERRLARSTDQIVAVGETVRDELDRLGIAAPERVAVVRYGLDLSSFSEGGAEARERGAEFRNQFRIPPDDVVVALVGRLARIKRIDRFLRIANAVAARSDSVRFLIVGDGPESALLRNLQEARTLGERLVWTGMYDDMPAVYAATDLVASTSDMEGTPLGLIEAHATGLPIVATDVGGVDEVVVGRRSGLLFATEDEAGMGAAIEELLLDSGRRRSLGLEGQKHVLQRFELGRMLDELEDLYHRVAVERSR